MKIKYNKVFGYYFEVTNSFKDLVPDYFIRKQTLANAERYTTDELKKKSGRYHSGGGGQAFSLEYDLFCDVRDQIAGEVNRIRRLPRPLQGLDVFSSLSLGSDQK